MEEVLTLTLRAGRPATVTNHTEAAGTRRLVKFGGRVNVGKHREVLKKISRVHETQDWAMVNLMVNNDPKQTAKTTVEQLQDTFDCPTVVGIQW